MTTNIELNFSKFRLVSTSLWGRLPTDIPKMALFNSIVSRLSQAKYHVPYVHIKVNTRSNYRGVTSFDVILNFELMALLDDGCQQLTYGTNPNLPPFEWSNPPNFLIHVLNYAIFFISSNWFDTSINFFFFDLFSRLWYYSL